MSRPLSATHRLLVFLGSFIFLRKSSDSIHFKMILLEQYFENISTLKKKNKMKNVPWSHSFPAGHNFALVNCFYVVSTQFELPRLFRRPNFLLRALSVSHLKSFQHLAAAAQSAAGHVTRSIDEPGSCK